MPEELEPQTQETVDTDPGDVDPNAGAAPDAPETVEAEPQTDTQPETGKQPEGTHKVWLEGHGWAYLDDQRLSMLASRGAKEYAREMENQKAEATKKRDEAPPTDQINELRTQLEQTRSELRAQQQQAQLQMHLNTLHESNPFLKDYPEERDELQERVLTKVVNSRGGITIEDAYKSVTSKMSGLAQKAVNKLISNKSSAQAGKGEAPGGAPAITRKEPVDWKDTKSAAMNLLIASDRN